MPGLRGNECQRPDAEENRRCISEIPARSLFDESRLPHLNTS
jgi:hypothetical protein